MTPRLLPLLATVFVLTSCLSPQPGQVEQVPSVGGSAATGSEVAIPPPTVSTGVAEPSTTALPPAAITPLPDYLWAVVPDPGERLTIAQYEKLAPSLGWNATAPGVCVSIAPRRFMEPGDFPSAEEWLAQVHLSVDDRLIAEHHSLLKTDSKGAWLEDPETGSLIWKEPDGSPLRVCYAATLGAGQHIVELVVVKTSGESVVYKWFFVLTE
jgi:hypothetical protein